MRIIGTGIDIVDIERVRALPDFKRAAELVFCESERLHMQQSRDAVQYFAGHFALKEAIIKAMPSACSYLDISIYKDGRRLRAKVKNAQKFTIEISMSHEFKYAIAHAIVVRS